MKASWEPVQEGSGDPSQENIRPIKGRDSVKVEWCGENLIKYPAAGKTNGIEITVDGSKLTVKGTCPSDTSIKSDAVYCPDGKYTLSSDVLIPAGAYISAYIKIEKLLLNKKQRKMTGKLSGNVQMLLYLEAGTYDFAVQVSLVPGTTAPTIYTPYRGDTLNLALPSTIYGGTVDAVMGAGTETWKLVTLYGTENWITPTNNEYYAAFGYPASTGRSVDGVASHYPYGTTIGCLYANKNGSVVLYGINDKITIADWKSYLAAQYAAGTPVQVCYKLAEPVPFTATGGGEIKALRGTNTLLTDVDTLTVTGREDLTHAISELRAAQATATKEK